MYRTECLWGFLEESKENCGNFEPGIERIQIFEEIMDLKKRLFSLFGGSKTPADGITSIFRMVDLIRITVIAQSAETNYPYIQPNIIPTLKNEVPLSSCFMRKSYIHGATILFVTYLIRSQSFPLKTATNFPA